MSNWFTKHDILTKLLSVMAAIILWSYFMSVQNPTRTVEYRDIAVQLTGVDQLYNSYNLKVVEDAAQGVMASYKGRAPSGHTDCFSDQGTGQPERQHFCAWYL